MTAVIGRVERAAGLKELGSFEVIEGIDPDGLADAATPVRNLGVT